MIDLLFAAARRHGDAPFLVHDDAVYSFADVAAVARSGARHLAAQGVRPGDKVVIAVSNRPLFLHCWFSVLAAGAIAVPIAHDAFGESLDYVVGQSTATALVTETGTEAAMRATLAARSVVILAYASESDFVRRAAADADDDGTEADDRVVAPSDSVAILYTSGTTGQPKGAVIPAESYRAAGRTIVDAIGIEAADRILVFLPLHHANPQMYALMSALTVGCSLVLVPRFSASALLDQAARHGATGFTYVGTVLTILSRVIDGPRPTTLRWCVGGGAPEPVWRDLVAKLGLRIHELYGMTETGGVTSINGIGDARIGSVGRPRDDLEVALLDDDDRPLANGVGEIAVRPRAPWRITTGYFDKPMETAAAIANLWFHTGDYGRFDEEGYLFFEGRKKDLIRRAGEMISPVAVELVAARFAGVADCAAVAVDDDIVGEEIKLVLVERGSLDCDALLAHLRAALPRHAMPRYLDFVDVIPKTPTEKVQRFRLKTSTARLVDCKDLSRMSSA